VLLKVRFAEISRTLLNEWSTRLATVNPQDLNGKGNYGGSSRSDGVIQFFLEEGGDCVGPVPGVGSCIDALINAAKSRGDFRSLAEPNLVTLPGREAYFLAGGEFPFPTIQAGASNQALTIVFKEFGIRLRYTPTVLRSGAIRLKLAPEVSSLDFANGLVVGGFQIPTILSRRAETEVELRPGQYLAIAGLMDNNMLKNVTKIPILGDLPIIGELFKSRETRQGRRELLVLISPELIMARATPQPLPTGEPGSWGLDRQLRQPVAPDTARRAAPAPAQR
jgi:pilus assembly protein CpaC